MELAIVEFRRGEILYDEGFHCYIDHKNLNFNVDALKKFGTRLDDRKPGVACHPVEDVAKYVVHWLTPRYEFSQSKPGPIALNFGGKNFGSFDKLFLEAIIPGFERVVKHRSSDLGNKYEDRDDAHLPDLETCRQRALKCGVQGRYINQPVTHTALEDASLCAELYRGWWEGKLGTVDNPAWR